MVAGGLSNAGVAAFVTLAMLGRGEKGDATARIMFAAPPLNNSGFDPLKQICTPYVPGARPLELTVIEIVADPNASAEMEAGMRPNQLGAGIVVSYGGQTASYGEALVRGEKTGKIVLPAFNVTCRACGAGEGPPCMALNARVTVSFTVTVTGCEKAATT